MKAGTVQLRITGDARLAAAQVTLAAVRLRHAAERTGRAYKALGTVVCYAQERQDAEAEHRIGLIRRDLDPCIDVQLVTTNEGFCRVVVRRLGGWQ